MKNLITDIIQIILGSFILAVGMNSFAIPNELAEGGAIGISMDLYYLFQWSPGVTLLLLNAVLVSIGYKLLDKRVTYYTIITIAANSFFLLVTKGIAVYAGETILGTIFAGVFIGIGIGIIIRAGGTTGGSTILAKIANRYFGWSISYAVLFFDLVVVFGSYFIIGAEKVMYTIISLYIAAKLIDFIVEGLNARKTVTIISRFNPEIADKINKEINRGVTIYSAGGEYMKEAREVLYIVIKKKELFKLKKIVYEIDHQAFVVIHDVRDVFGQAKSPGKA
ncbi:YitT family protein [Paenibacillus sp. sptzw28]|uniref:YitT family protein n=1 Tax=Paenibacillus sp. sptzw28 TaxID=715179 RepID=UPI001C6F2AC5|nr:YitT family protein [Paenibacillus sp. sptzw28]QYR21858.1 YitT family protein [Paenibacillus sp. sptzw28]